MTLIIGNDDAETVLDTASCTAHHAARAAGRGHEVPTAWFTQEYRP